MTSTIADVLAGTIGQFWPQMDTSDPSLEGDPVSGVAQWDPAGQDFELKGLIDDPHSAFFASAQDRDPEVDYFLGVTEHGGVLLDGVRQTGSKISIGGNRAATRRYTADHIVRGLDFEELNGRSFTSASLHIEGVARWAGLTAVTSEAQYNDSGLPVSLQLNVQAPEAQSGALGDLTLEIGSTWSVSGPDDARVVRTPTTISAKSEAGEKLSVLTAPLGRVQDLLGLAHQGYVRASGGRARISERTAHGHSGELWSRYTMSDRPSIRKPKSMSEIPLFYLSDIGGISGVIRWVQLSENHPRLTRSIVSPFHIGHMYAEQLLIETGAAIDYWRGVHARTAAWAGQTFQPLAIADALGQPFKNWVGDVDQWAKLFWDNYNGLKHYIPTYTYDTRQVALLALSGATAVTCLALKEISDPQSDICERVLSSHRWDSRGRSVREMVYDSIP